MKRWEHSYQPMTWETPVIGANHWEMKVDGKTLKGDDVWKYIGDMGLNGWELVSAVPLLASQGGNAWTNGHGLWFKRCLD